MSDKDWTQEGRDATAPPRVSNIPPAYHNDKTFYKVWLHFAGWTLILCVVGMLFLAYNEHQIPEAIVAVASGVVGLLGGIFAAKPSHT